MRKNCLVGIREAGHPENFKIVKRVLNKEDIGNFTPFFCWYKKQQYLVKISDEYPNTFYIEVKV